MPYYDSTKLQPIVKEVIRLSNRQRKRKTKKGSPVIVFIVIVFCALMGMRTFSLYKESRELSKKQEALAARMESEEKRKEDLEELEKYMKTKKYMEEVAKSKLGLVYPNEILIQPENK